MAQIVHGYIVPRPLLKQIGELARTKKIDVILTELRNLAKVVQPTYPHPGYLMTVAISYLEEHGAALPLCERDPDVRRVLDTPLSLLGCMDQDSAELFAALVGGMRPTDDDFDDYFRKMSDEPFPGAPEAMRAACKYLIAGAAEVKSPDQFFILLLV
jgi:hypothetical protein